MLEIAGGILIALVIIFCLPGILGALLIFLAIIIVGFILIYLHNSVGLPIVILTCFVTFCVWTIFEFLLNNYPDHWNKISRKISSINYREILGVGLVCYTLLFSLFLLLAYIKDLIF